MRALRILAVDQTHGCGYEVEVAAGSEMLAARAARGAGACSTYHGRGNARLYSASACVMWSLREQCSPPQTRLLAPRSNL